MTFDATVATVTPAVDQSATPSTLRARVAPAYAMSGEIRMRAHETTMAAKLAPANQNVSLGMLGTIMARVMLTWVTARSDVKYPYGCTASYPIAPNGQQIPSVPTTSSHCRAGGLKRFAPRAIRQT